MEDTKVSSSAPKGLVGRLAASGRRLLGRSRMTQQSALLILGITVGLASGAGAVLFRWLISAFTGIFFNYGAVVLGFMGHYYVIVLPALGGAIVGPIVYFLAREVRGSGVPEVMEAVAYRGGRIRPRVVILKPLACAICLGSGGSAGREGPIAQIGAALGSTLGQLLNLSDRRVRTLVACGGAGGIAATFNAPIGGAFFALEVILGEWTAEAFAPVVAAAVAASAVGRVVFGDVPAFLVPEYGLATFTELPLFMLLGLFAALVGIVLTIIIYWAEDGFEKIPVPPYLLPVLGGLIVGGVGLYHRELYGVGYGLIEAVLRGVQINVTALLVLMALKLVATSATLGSGGSGGIFSPSLFLGALLGATMGLACHHIFPGMTTTPGAYALVGMGAVFAATSHAPITAVLIVFELTRDYRMILPLLLACGVSVVIARAIYRFSIYNLKLVRRGVHVELGRDANLLNEITIGQAMTTQVINVTPSTTVREAAHLFETTKHHGFPIVDESDQLHGIVTITDVRRARRDQLDSSVCEIATHNLVIAFPDESLNDGLRKLGLRDVGRIPVVAREDHTRLLGLITRKNIISAYNRALMRQHTKLEETQDEEYFE